MSEQPSEKNIQEKRPRDENFDIKPAEKKPHAGDREEYKQQNIWIILAIIMAGCIAAVISILLFNAARNNQHTVVPVVTTETGTEEDAAFTASVETVQTAEMLTSEEESKTETEAESTEETEAETESESEKESVTETEAETKESETEKEKKSKKKKKKTEESTAAESAAETPAPETAPPETAPPETETSAEESRETEPSSTETQAAEEFEYGGVIFRLEGESLTMVKCYSGDAIMEMDTVHGHTVTAIGPDAFNGCEHLTHFNLPNGIISIDAHAFANCKNLKEIWIPDTVVWIDDSCFENSAHVKILSHKDTYAAGYAAAQGISWAESNRISPVVQ